jgi:pyrimidine oxygenase
VFSNNQTEEKKMNHVELGVFIPVGNNGWIISKNSPQYKPTFELNKKVAQLAESIGFERIFSMAKWKGFGGEVEFWKHSLESIALMSGLAAVTKNIRLVTSVAPSLIHPAVFAKMAATLDDICNGRMAVNLVHAGHPIEHSQMGLYPENYESYRYEYTEEWLEVVKRLWTEEKVNHQGKYFTLTDCEAFPKPVSDPSIVIATGSEWGYDFVGRACNEAFIGGSTLEILNANSLKVKENAQQRYGRKIKTSTFISLIMGSSDAEANDILQHYWAGADLNAIETVLTQGRINRYPNGFKQKELQQKADEGDYSPLFYAGRQLIGGPETIANSIESMVVNGQLDGLMFTFPDFVKGLTDFDKLVMPLLREKNLLMSLGNEKSAS